MRGAKPLKVCYEVRCCKTHSTMIMQRCKKSQRTLQDAARHTKGTSISGFNPANPKCFMWTHISRPNWTVPIDPSR